MATYVSMVTWTGDPRPGPRDVRDAIRRRDDALMRAGLHSVALLPGERECAAVMVASVPDERALGKLARSILPDADVTMEAMRFDQELTPEEYVVCRA
jgi:hypothetical protein